MISDLYILIYNFLEKFTLLGYFSFCLLATFILIVLVYPRKKVLSVKLTEQGGECKRLNNVDFLRILLTYVIVLHHEFQPLNIANEAHNSVEMFFVISGFMLVYNYKSEMGIMEFIKRKIVAFLPYLLLADLLALCLFLEIDISNLFAGVFLYADTLLCNKFSVYAPSWFLVTLFWVLILYFSLMKIFSKKVCALIIGIIAFITWSGMSDMGFILSPNNHLPLLTNGQVRALSCISVGYFIALNYKQEKEAHPKVLHTLLEMGLLIGLGGCLFAQSYKLPIYLIMILFVFLLWSFIHQKGYISYLLEKINWAPFARYMLPIFMTHWVITMLQQYGRLWTDYSSWVRLVLSLFCATLLGIVSYHVVQLGYYFQNIRDKKSCK